MKTFHRLEGPKFDSRTRDQLFWLIFYDCPQLFFYEDTWLLSWVCPKWSHYHVTSQHALSKSTLRDWEKTHHVKTGAAKETCWQKIVAAHTEVQCRENILHFEPSRRKCHIRNTVCTKHCQVDSTKNTHVTKQAAHVGNLKKRKVWATWCDNIKMDFKRIRCYSELESRNLSTGSVARCRPKCNENSSSVRCRNSLYQPSH
jgi:hypothetical protein